MKRSALAAATVAIVVASCSGCAVMRPLEQPSLENDTWKVMNDIDVLPPFPQPAPASGSLWSSAGFGAAFSRDPRAYRVNDLLTVVLQERSTGTSESQTDLNRASDSGFGASVAFGLESTSPAPGKFSLNEVLNTSSSSTFAGDGKTARGNRLDGSLTTRVMRVLPNGDLVIAGQKNVIVNRERQVLTLVGSVRALDVGADNRVSSAAIGDLTVRLWGRGEVDSAVRQGWFQRAMNRLWPF